MSASRSRRKRQDKDREPGNWVISVSYDRKRGRIWCPFHHLIEIPPEDLEDGDMVLVPLFCAQCEEGK